MNYLPLGKSDIKISAISFGCMSLGEDDAENNYLLNQALDQGITFFDTADLYSKGANEITVGKAFKGRREKVVIATKVGNQWRTDGSGWDWNPTKAYIMDAVNKSLKRLQTDYIDLYQLHGGTLNDPIDETIEAFESLKSQGKIRCYGISSIRPNVIREYVKRANMESVMMQYSLLDRRPEETCLNLLHQHSVSVLARGSLAQGLLTGKEAKSYLGQSAKVIQQAIENIKSISFPDNNEVARAIQFVLHHPAVTSALLGIRNRKQLEDALKSAVALKFEEKEFNALTKNIGALKYEQHR